LILAQTSILTGKKPNGYCKCTSTSPGLIASRSSIIFVQVLMGLRYKRERGVGECGVVDGYDVKGVFLSGGKIGAYDRMIVRCDWMLANGLIEEFFGFLKEGLGREGERSPVSFFFETIGVRRSGLSGLCGGV
jgi:hypothetical protein